jgi:hypothetical protein
MRMYNSPFCIFAEPYRRTSAGVKALFALANKIHSLAHIVFTYILPKNIVKYQKLLIHPF